MDWILGISGFSHSLSFALLDGTGECLMLAEEERYTRVRNSYGAPYTCFGLSDLLRSQSVSKRDLEVVAIGFEPAGLPSPSIRHARRAMERSVLREWGLGTIPVRHVHHHLAHAASAFYPSPYDRAAVLTIDGRGESTTTAIFAASRDRPLRMVWHQTDASLGLAYLAVTRWLGLGDFGDEGKTMGLAAYGQARMVRRLERSLIRWHSGEDRLSSPVHLLGSDYSLGLVRSFLGPERDPSDPLTDEHQDIAASLQALTDRLVLALALKARRLTNLGCLCYAGGVALNSSTNSVLQKSGIFDKYFIPPHAGDVGTSLGAAYVAGRRSGMPLRAKSFFSPYLGAAPADPTLSSVRRRSDVDVARCDAPPRAAAEAIARGKVIGWFRGRAEVGPRALGNRSILANPREAATRDRINAEIKFREPWRPFAPAVLQDCTPGLFIDGAESFYMLAVEKYRPRGPKLDAVTHTDGTARYQSVTTHSNPAFAELLEHVRRLTGIGVVLNTSLNGRGEPIVNTPEQAVAFLVKSGLDELYIEDWCIRRKPNASPRNPLASDGWAELPSASRLRLVFFDRALPRLESAPLVRGIRALLARGSREGQVVEVVAQAQTERVRGIVGATVPIQRILRPAEIDASGPVVVVVADHRFFAYLDRELEELLCIVGPGAPGVHIAIPMATVRPWRDWAPAAAAWMGALRVSSER